MRVRVYRNIERYRRLVMDSNGIYKVDCLSNLKDMLESHLTKHNDIRYIRRKVSLMIKLKRMRPGMGESASFGMFTRAGNARVGAFMDQAIEEEWPLNYFWEQHRKLRRDKHSSEAAETMVRDILYAEMCTYNEHPDWREEAGKTSDGKWTIPLAELVEHSECDVSTCQCSDGPPFCDRIENMGLKFNPQTESFENPEKSYFWGPSLPRG